MEYYDDSSMHMSHVLRDVISRLSASRVGDTNSSFCTYQIYQPPHLVLDTLEHTAGCRVVAANSCTEHRSDMNISYHWQIWTLHKQA